MWLGCQQRAYLDEQGDSACELAAEQGGSDQFRRHLPELADHSSCRFGRVNSRSSQSVSEPERIKYGLKDQSDQGSSNGGSDPTQGLDQALPKRRGSWNLATEHPGIPDFLKVGKNRFFLLDLGARSHRSTDSLAVYVKEYWQGCC
ncbi:MAG TPA: hypothetical protein VGC06_14600 [Actinomycetes bacterium]